MTTLSYSAIGRPRSRRAYATLCTTLLALALLAGCATSRSIRNGDSAANHGDWDMAVAFYREALGRSPGRTDLRIKLERATRFASADHMARARELEAQEQLPGAIAEYRIAADLDPSNTLARQKATELERRLREQIDASRPRTVVDSLRQQGGQTSAIPRLDPRAVVPEMRFPNAAVRDILRTISELTGINIIYDQGLDVALSRPYPIDIQEMPLEDILNQILEANQLTYKVQNSRTIFVYQDNPQNRARYEEIYLQMFPLSNLTPAEANAQLMQLVGTNTQAANRPVIMVNEVGKSITVRATASTLRVIEEFIRRNDRPLPEVLIEAEILEVDRSYLRQLGLDLSQWAFGLSFSPEVAPGENGAPPFNLNTISRGVSAADFYMSTPSALIRLLESNSNTRTLAKPSSRGTAGTKMVLTMGQDVPIPTTVFQSGAVGGVANIPTTSVNYQPVGVNLAFTPSVTYEDEIVLADLTLEKSGLGSNLEVGGQTFPTIVSRKAASSLRLRDGESTIIAGLLLDEDRQTHRSLPGLANVPLIRAILGSSEKRIEQTDIVMIITPRIVRGHGLTPDDVKPVYVGTGQNMTTGNPPLLSPEAIGTTTAPAAAPVAAPTAPPQGPPTPTPAPIVPVPPAAAAPIAQPQAQIILSAPSAGPDGALTAGGGPHTMPIQITNVADVSTLSLSITYDPAVVKTPSVTPGSFMGQGGASSTFVPGIDAAAGRIDIAFSRPPGGAGATGSGLLAAISFVAGDPGTSDVRITGVATTSTGQTVPLQFTSARVTVR